MSYALNLAEDGRILSATYPQYAPGAPAVDELPPGDISEYLYVDGAFVHDPLPVEPVEPAPYVPTAEERLAALEDYVAELTADTGGAAL